MVNKKEFLDPQKKFDTQEFELPDTLYEMDIESRVFQSIVMQCLVKIEGVSLVEGNFIDTILTREGNEGLSAIYIEQDTKNHSVSVKMEVNVRYGVSLPTKAEEIQSKIAEEITKLTGIHVSAIHVVFKNVYSADQLKKRTQEWQSSNSINSQRSAFAAEQAAEEYADEF